MPSMRDLVERVEGLSKVELDSEAVRLVRVTQLETARLIAHLAEIDRRDYALEWGFSGLFAYCTGRLGMSEPQAGLRTQVARVCRQYPAVLDSLAANRMSLTVAGRIAPHLTAANAEEVIRTTEGMSKREVVEYVTRFKPKPLVKSGARAVPEPAQPSATSLGDSTRLSDEDPSPKQSSDLAVSADPSADEPDLTTQSAASAPTGAPKPNPVRVEPARPGWTNLRFPADDPLMEKIERLGEVLGLDATRQLEDLVEVAVDLALEKKDPKQRHERRLKRQAKKARAAAEEAKSQDNGDDPPAPVKPESEAVDSLRLDEVTTPPSQDTTATEEDSISRAVPAAVRDRVFERAGHQCEFVGPDGTRCSQRTKLQADHAHPFAMSGHGPDGPHRESNIRCLCHAHNQWYARRHYGSDFIQRKIDRN